MLTDLRYAARQLRKARAFTLLAVATLGLAIGGATALFSLVDAVVLRQLPYKEPQQLVEIWGQDQQRTGMRVPGAILEALRARSQTLQAVGTHDPTSGVVSTAEGALDIRGQTVSSNFVDVFGVSPMVGRGFVPEDERPGAPAVMLVSADFWRRYLGSDPNAVGRSVQVDAVPYTVIGIMPPEFRTTFVNIPAELWTVYAGNSSRRRERELGYEIVARMRPGMTIDQARREVQAIASEVNVEGWSTSNRRLGLVPLKEEVIQNRANALVLLMAAVGVVLAIACANIAQLLLARSDQRIIEFATRKALGARTSQVFRLALFESLLLSLAGGMAGIALAYWLVPVMVALAPSEIPRLAAASVNTRVLMIALAASVVTGCAFGLAPAVRLSRSSILNAMKRVTGSSSKQRARFRAALVVIQVAAAVTLLAAAGLVGHTFLRLLPTSPGFATDSRTAFAWSLRAAQFPDAADRLRRIGELKQRLEATPGIFSVAVATGMPFADDESTNTPIRLADDQRPIGATTLRADLRAVSPTFFELLRLPLLQGRPFDASAGGTSRRVAIVNRTLAHAIDPAGHVIGRTLRVGAAASDPPYEIIGLVEDTRWWGTTVAPLNEVYIPFEVRGATYGYLIVHSQLNAGAVTKSIRSAFNTVLPGAALPPARSAVSLDEMIARSFAGPRFNATLIGAFSLMALTLAITGLFGLVAYSVSQRRRELALRMALGATSSSLVLTSIRSAMLLTGVGVVVGLVIAMYLTRFIQGQLYGVVPQPAPTFAGAAALMLIAAALGAYLPARRTAQADAMVALRE